MDLALLVYGLSLLNGVGTLLGITLTMLLIATGIAGIFTATWKFDGSEYSWDLNHDGTVKDSVMRGRLFGQKIFKFSAIGSVVLAIIMTVLPNERTAYMMVGAYATQKVAENERVQEAGKKVLTLIEQKLDAYIEEGVKNVEGKKHGKSKD